MFVLTTREDKTEICVQPSFDLRKRGGSGKLSPRLFGVPGTPNIPDDCPGWLSPSSAHVILAHLRKKDSVTFLCTLRLHYCPVSYLHRNQYWISYLSTEQNRFFVRDVGRGPIITLRYQVTFYTLTYMRQRSRAKKYPIWILGSPTPVVANSSIYITKSN